MFRLEHKTAGNLSQDKREGLSPPTQNRCGRSL